MEWIKCSDRMPAFDTEVLLLVDAKFGKVITIGELSIYREGTLDQYTKWQERNKFNWGDTIDELDENKQFITHWMPLPESPQPEIK